MAYTARQRNVGTFNIDYHSEVDDRRYVGSFTCKKLSIRDMTVIGVRKAQLNGGLHYTANNPGHGVDADTDQLNGWLAHLEVCLLQTPKWWNLDEISDFDLVFKVYEEVMNFENTFLGRGNRGTASREGPGGTGEGDSSQAEDQADVAGTSRRLVEQEVQSALKP